MKKIKISIIIPVYNVEKYLSQCLDSLVNQTFKDIEIICVNDGSPDNSLEILNSYAQKDSRVKVISQENSGASIARNNALDHVTGEYIMFVDGDDWVELDTCKIALEASTSYGADVVMWDYIGEFSAASRPKNIFDSDKVFDGTEVKPLHRRFVGLLGKELSEPEKADALCTVWGKLYKRNSIYDYNIKFYDIRKIGTYEDGLFNLDVFENISKVVYIHKHLYHYRKDNEGSITSVYKEKLQSQHENIHKYLSNYIQSHNLSDDYKKALNNRIALELVGYGLNILKLPNGKIKELKNIISDLHYRQAYKQLDLKYFPVHWKVFYGCAKHNFATGVYLLLLCIKKIINR